MTKLPYLNVGCGNRYHNEWTNIDMNAKSEHVIEHNILGRLPFADGQFEFVYHSHVLEHLPRQSALPFLAECCRVLKVGGTIRVVVPDLENIARTYLQALADARQATNTGAANHKWMTLELLDQSVRNAPGGDFYQHIIDGNIENLDFVRQRAGSFVDDARAARATKSNKKETLRDKIKKVQRFGVGAFLLQTLLPGNVGRYYALGRFRMSGEIHQWMYDSFSLGQLLQQAGFANPVVKSAFDCSIDQWSSYNLDNDNDLEYIPQSLYMEAVKA